MGARVRETYGQFTNSSLFGRALGSRDMRPAPSKRLSSQPAFERACGASWFGRLGAAFALSNSEVSVEELDHNRSKVSLFGL